MKRRAFAAALAAVCLIGATVPATRLKPGALYPQVVQVECDTGRGTAFAIRGGKRLSVAHVTNISGCKIDGEPVHATRDEGVDFSVIEAAEHNGFPINCEGFRPGQWYFAIGYARGWQWQTMVMILATFQNAEGQTVLIGPPTVIPGMSGGPVLNSAGEVVGTVNRYNDSFALSFSQPLKGTSVCAGSGGLH